MNDVTEKLEAVALAASQSAEYIRVLRRQLDEEKERARRSAQAVTKVAEERDALRREAARRCACEFEPGAEIGPDGRNPGPSITCGYRRIFEEVVS